MHSDKLLWSLVVIAAILIAIALLFLMPRLSPAARLRRRLRKTHSRIAYKTRRPSVKFSAKTPKE